MEKKYNAFQIIGKVYKQTLIMVPFSGTVGLLNYFVQGIMPAIAAVLLSKLYNYTYRTISGEELLEEMILYGKLLLALYLCNYFLQFISNITINAGVYEKCTSCYRLKIVEKVSKIPLVFFDEVMFLNRKRRAEDCVDREILSQIYMSSIVFFTNGVSVVSVMLVLASYSIWFLPISLISVAPFFIARKIRGREFYQLKTQLTATDRTVTYLWNLLTEKKSMKEIRVMNSGQYLIKKWRDARFRMNSALWKQSLKEDKTYMVCEFIRIMGYGGSVVLALLLALNGKISLGVFGACLSAFVSVQEATRQFLIDFGGLPQKVAFANDYFAFMDIEEEGITDKKLNDSLNRIDVENISFYYPGAGQPAVKQVSFSIKKGEKIAILGENGSGKTTLSKLLMGIYQPDEGRILVNGVPLSEYKKESLWKKVSVVAQNYVKYLLTLRENVAISDIEEMNNDRKIVKCLQLNNIETDDIDIQMGKEFGGIELSEGQWQKLAIARGVFKNSEIVFVDEPTSSLDPLVESEVLSRFLKIVENKTAIIISHRVGLCKSVSKIIVMKNGQICEIGTHNQLYEKKGEYYKLYASQEKWYQR